MFINILVCLLFLKVNGLPFNGETCKNDIGKYFKHNEDVQVLNIYKNLNFSIDTTESRKGYYDIKYTQDEITNNPKIDVILIPHSHCDAGWLETYESYSRQTNRILNNAHKYLPMFERMKFIYAEMGFFEMYWSQLDKTNREKLKELLNSGRYEIVTGGWVQNDEANSFYYGILMQLIEGHEFLKNHLNYIPKNHWSIDPFGLSTTMAYIMKKSGFENAVISRVHYLMKQKFAHEKLFEFNWRQLTGGKEDDDLFTHVLPYDGYLFYEHCGPDPSVCCSFDFLRLHVYSCPKGRPEGMTNDNIAIKSELIADQFRKRGFLMDNRATFIPLGYDFAWSFESEWEDQYTNYEKIFDYINKNSDKFNMNIRWGTVNDYFEAVRKNIKEVNGKPKILSGDFFTYSDKDNRYWSGYYVSRPFHKRFERLLEHYLRAADIIYSSVISKKGPIHDLDYNLIVKTRRILSIFQHHDGITGTSKKFVMDDYRDKLYTGVKNCYEVIEKSIQYGINHNNSLEIVNKIESSDSYETNKIINQNKTIIIMNPLGHEKETITCVKVPSNDFFILTDDRSIPKQEYHPIIENFDHKIETNIDNNGFNLCFEVSLPPLGLKTYNLEKSIMYKPPMAQIFLSKSKIKSNYFNISDGIKNNKIKNPFIDVTFNSKTGFIDSIGKTKIDLHFTKYGILKDGTPSGAYIFNPDGPSKRLNENQNIFIMSEGKLKSIVFVKGFHDINLYHTYEINKFDKSITIQNIVDISKMSDFELGMKFETSINNNDTFYTDLNGFQLIKRKFISNIPIQGNFYPFPSMMYIEDNDKRLNILTGQPLGVSSLKNGNIEILIDRRSDHDDDCGMGEGIKDTSKAWSKFSLILEDLIDNQINNNEDPLTGFVSTLTHTTLYSLLYPPIIMTTTGKLNLQDISNFSILKNPLPCDIHLVMARSLLKKEDYDMKGKNNEVIRESSNDIALIFNRYIDDCRISNTNDNKKCIDNQTGKLIFTDLFNFNYKSINDASLTLLNINNQTILHTTIDKQEMKSIKVSF